MNCCRNTKKVLIFHSNVKVQGAPIHQAGVTWTADSNLGDAREAFNAAGLTGVDTMSWWCDDPGSGVKGIAYVGALCSTWGVNLNEKISSVAGSGFVSTDRTVYLIVQKNV